MQKYYSFMPPKPIPSSKIYKDEISCLLRNKGFDRKQVSEKKEEMWQNLSQKEKQKYIDLNKEQTKLYKKQMLDLSNLGYFTLEDGTKSTDEINLKYLVNKINLLKKRERCEQKNEEQKCKK